METIKLNTKLLNTLKNAVVYLMFVAQAGLLGYYLLCGVSFVFGERINILSAITLVSGIFKLSSLALYRALFGTVLGVMYFVFAIKILKEWLGSIQYIKPSLKDIELNSHAVKSVALIFESFGKCLFLTIAYTVISGMISLYKVPVDVIIMFVFAGALSFAARIIIVLIRRNDLLDAVYTQVVCYGIFLASIVALLCNTLSASLYTTFGFVKAAIYAIQYSNGLMGWITLFEQFAVNNVLLIVIQVIILLILKDVLGATTHYAADSNTVKIMAMVSAFTAACHVLISAYVAYELGFDLISNTFNSILKYASLVILPAITWYTLKFPTELTLPWIQEKEKPDENQSGNANDNNVVDGNNESTEEKMNAMHEEVNETVVDDNGANGAPNTSETII